VARLLTYERQGWDEPFQQREEANLNQQLRGEEDKESNAI
jgi:hypothetical protein